MTTAIVYDPFHRNHTLAGHPENAQRLARTWNLLEQDGILEKLHQVESVPAPQAAITAVHDPAYLAQLDRLSERGGGRLDPDTYLTAASYEAALLAAGGLLQVTDAVLAGRADNGFALVRPPGHHARPRAGMGFCLLGNVAIAARHAHHQRGAERLLIVDFDVHHGNGTQEMFYGDGTVLFFSVHQFPYYPGTGAVDEIGRGAGAGRTVNVPFAAGAGDASYLVAFREVLAPLAHAFSPDLILVSAGYDGHWMDPLAQHRLSIGGYAALVTELLGLADTLCGGRLVCTLEGGYHLEILPHAVLSTLRTLCGDARGISDPAGAAPGTETDTASVLSHVKQRHGLDT